MLNIFLDENIVILPMIYKIKCKVLIMATRTCDQLATYHSNVIHYHISKPCWLSCTPKTHQVISDIKALSMCCSLFLEIFSLRFPFALTPHMSQASAQMLAPHKCFTEPTYPRYHKCIQLFKPFNLLFQLFTMIIFKHTA